MRPVIWPHSRSFCGDTFAPEVVVRELRPEAKRVLIGVLSLAGGTGCTSPSPCSPDGQDPGLVASIRLPLEVQAWG